MGLNVADLAEDIKEAIKNNSAVGGANISTKEDAQTAIDAAINNMAQGIAQAVVKNIKNSLVIVESKGFGYQSTPVNSKSIKKIGIEVD